MVEYTNNHFNIIQLNMYDLLIKKASRRLKILKTKHQNISKYFYNVNRCGIAHGDRPIKFDFDVNLSDISSDVCIIRLLAKMAILNKM